VAALRGGKEILEGAYYYFSFVLLSANLRFAIVIP